MTREEAIEFGNMWLEINEDCKDSNAYEFFQLSIEALKQKALEQKFVLDKIKEDIKDNTYFINETTEKEGIDFETVERIIDKYKSESEG